MNRISSRRFWLLVSFATTVLAAVPRQLRAPTGRHSCRPMPQHYYNVVADSLALLQSLSHQH